MSINKLSIFSRSIVFTMFSAILISSLAADQTACSFTERPLSPTPGPEIEPHLQSTQIFLDRARQAFEEKVWGDFSGYLQHRSPQARISTEIELAVQIEAPQFMRARIVLHRNSVYDLTRVIETGKPKVTIRQPTEDRTVTLENLGLQTDDLLFVFLYWDLLAEDEPETVRGRPCRVLHLQDPESERQVRAWFSREHLAPLQIAWLEDDGKTPERTLEMTDFESRRGVWYVKSFRLSGRNWQTRVRFTEGSLYSYQNRPPPKDLF